MGGLGGIQGFLLDLDGTVYQDGSVVLGVAEALAGLTRRGVPYRFATNTTSRPRSALARELCAMGLSVAEEEIWTAPRAGRELLLSLGFTRCILLVNTPVISEFTGITHVPDENGSPQAVVLGDIGDGFTFAALNGAFQALLGGARLVTLARNRAFRSGGRLVLDVGPFAAALEYASGQTALLAGKPSPDFFRAAIAGLRLPPAEIAVVGDDLENDVGGAQACGLKGVLVRTGKFRAEELSRSPIRPDAILDSLAEVGSLV